MSAVVHRIFFPVFAVLGAVGLRMHPDDTCNLKFKVLASGAYTDFQCIGDCPHEPANACHVDELQVGTSLFIFCMCAAQVPETPCYATFSSDVDSDGHPVVSVSCTTNRCANACDGPSLPTVPGVLTFPCDCPDG